MDGGTVIPIKESCCGFVGDNQGETLQLRKGVGRVGGWLELWGFD
jgi:hypothetical protein